MASSRIQIQMLDGNQQSQKVNITVNPEVATGTSNWDKINASARALRSITNNTYVDTVLTKTYSVTEELNNEDD